MKVYPKHVDAMQGVTSQFNKLQYPLPSMANHYWCVWHLCYNCSPIVHIYDLYLFSSNDLLFLLFRNNRFHALFSWHALLKLKSLQTSYQTLTRNVSHKNTKVNYNKSLTWPSEWLECILHIQLVNVTL